MHLFEGPDLGHSTYFVKESYKGKKKKNWKQHSTGFKPTTSLLRRVRSTVVLQQLAIEQDLHCHICSSIFLGNGHQLKMFGVHTARHRLFCWRIFPAYFWVVVIQTSWDFMGEWVRESMGVCVCACVHECDIERVRKKEDVCGPAWFMAVIFNGTSFEWMWSEKCQKRCWRVKRASAAKFVFDQDMQTSPDLKNETLPLNQTWLIHY